MRKTPILGNKNSNFILGEFFAPVLTGGFSLNLNDIKSLQVSKTLLSIVADLNRTGSGWL